VRSVVVTKLTIKFGKQTPVRRGFLFKPNC
jgi:hypothetical protein